MWVELHRTAGERGGTRDSGCEGREGREGREKSIKSINLIRDQSNSSTHPQQCYHIVISQVTAALLSWLDSLELEQLARTAGRPSAIDR